MIWGRWGGVKGSKGKALEQLVAGNDHNKFGATSVCAQGEETTAIPDGFQP